MSKLKELIDQRRVEASDKTYERQREFCDADAITDLQESVKTLTDRVTDLQTNHNHFFAELSEVNAAIDVLTNVCEGIQRIVDRVGFIAARLDTDEELIGIDDESDHCLGTDLTVMSFLESHEAQLVAYKHQVSDLHEEFREKIDVLQKQINVTVK